jgi:hypothetical protein
MGGKNSTARGKPVLGLDGKPMVFAVTKGPVFDTHGQVVGLFGISRDITTAGTGGPTAPAVE